MLLIVEEVDVSLSELKPHTPVFVEKYLPDSFPGRFQPVRPQRNAPPLPALESDDRATRDPRKVLASGAPKRIGQSRKAQDQDSEGSEVSCLLGEHIGRADRI